MDILDLILKDTYTQAQLKRRLLGLKKYYSQHLYGTGAKDSPDMFASSNDLAWFTTVRETLSAQFNQSNYQDIVADIDQRVQALPTITVFLPVDMTDTELSLLGSEIRHRYNPHLVLDINYDPDLIAGCAFAVGGVYKDYSLKEKLPQIRATLTKSLQELPVI